MDDTWKTGTVFERPNGRDAVDGFRPVCCFLRRLLTDIIADGMCSCLERKNSMVEELEGCKRGVRSTIDKIIIDNTKDSKRKRTNVTMAWRNCKRAFHNRLFIALIPLMLPKCD